MNFVSQRLRFATGPAFLLTPLLLLTTSPNLPATTDGTKNAATGFGHQLSAKILPYWFDTGLDRSNGGYRLADNGRGGGTQREKQLVGQARMIWTFAHAHRKGFSTAERDYLQAAEHGYRFLVDKFLDRANGGYFWRTDPAGQPVTDRKILYGESFVIYALVELHRASGRQEPLERALALFRLLQEKARDPKHGGWIEHFTRDWQPLLDPKSGAEVEVAGFKSANAHLHFMEALAELYDVTRDRDVRRALVEAREINLKYFYPKKAGRSCFHRKLDWSEVTDPKSAGLSYGHNVEFAWLLIRAEEVLGRRRSWNHFYAHLDHALKYGCDHERGGLYNRGIDDQPANQTDKVWWVQAEWVAALTDALQHRDRPDYARALGLALEFIQKHQADPKDGIWFDTVTAAGDPKNPAKAHSWKANYHDVRALVKFVEAFAPEAMPKTASQRP